MKIIFAALTMLLVASSSYAADVKVMRGVGLVEDGENCKLINEADYYRMTNANYDAMYAKAITLKQMMKEGYKIVYVKDFISKSGADFIFIFSKE